ncbi:unnamed protein product, partial [Anisakis simplex]|uniref:Uncharacterized protein n=1 Tax=Anisakis simplex TaxID=6269 RepID=A0A0M3JNN8_ANISI
MAGRGRKRHNRKPNDVGDARMGSVNQQQLINQSNSQSSNTGNNASNSNITSNKNTADTKTNDTSRSHINGVLINDGEMPGSSRMNNRDRDGKSSGVIQQMSTLWVFFVV